MKKFIAALMCATMLVFSFTACSKKDNSNKFVVGFDAEFPPMGFVADDGSYQGFDLDLAQEVANRLGKEFVAQPIAWDSKDQELSSGNLKAKFNGHLIYLIGCQNGPLDIMIYHTNVNIMGEGDNVVGFGSKDKTSGLSIRQSALDMVINASTPLGFGTSRHDIGPVGPIALAKINGIDFTVKSEEDIAAINI